MKKENNQNGIISLVVLFGMILILVFSMTFYFKVRNGLKFQEYNDYEINRIYSKNNNKISNIEYAETNVVIPISNIKQLNIAGSGNYLRIDNVIYQCGRGMSYILNNDIIVDVDEDIIAGTVGFNDYKFFSSSYHIDKASHQIVYFKDDNYWKCIAYQKFEDEKKKLVQNKTYISNEYCNLEESIKINQECEFMVVWNSSEKFDNVKKSSQFISSKLNNIRQIKVFEDNFNKIEDEFYVFIKI